MILISEFIRQAPHIGFDGWNNGNGRSGKSKQINIGAGYVSKQKKMCVYCICYTLDYVSLHRIQN